MIETTEREKKLLKIIDETLHILSAYVIFYNQVTQNVMWVMDVEKKLNARAAETEAIEILNAEFGTDYKKAKEPELMLQREE